MASDDYVAIGILPCEGVGEHPDVAGGSKKPEVYMSSKVEMQTTR